MLEQNLRPGLTNRVLGRFVDRIFTSFRESVDYFPADKVVLAGTPVRWRELPEVEREAERFHLLVFGGSAGARRINETVLGALAHLGEEAASFRVTHQSGRADEDRVRQGYASLPCEAEVLPFIDQMDRGLRRGGSGGLPRGRLHPGGADAVRQARRAGPVPLRGPRPSASQRAGAGKGRRRGDDRGAGS